MPEAIVSRFKVHDERGNFREFDEPIVEKMNSGTQTQENPQEEQDDEEIQILSEPEIMNHLSLLK